MLPYLLAIFTAIIACSIWGAFEGILSALIVYLLSEFVLLKSRIAKIELKLSLNTKPAPEPTPAPESKEQASWIPKPPVTAKPALERAEFPGEAEIGLSPETQQLLNNCKTYIKDFFTQGNVFAKVGIIILFFGFGFLVKYAAQYGFIPLEMRLTLAAFASIVILTIGWLLREQRPDFALAMQGGGIGIFYLVAFSAYRLYDLIPAGLSFSLLLMMTLTGGLLAILQNSRTLIILAVTGGFLAPILASSGQGSHIELFSYYALLNSSILVISIYRSWRPLNILGFIFTFVIGTAWGFYQYKPEYYLSTQIFLIIYFLFYVAIPIFYAKRYVPELKRSVDGTLVFGTPLIAYTLQIALVESFTYGIAISSICLGLFYSILAYGLFLTKQKNLRLLCEAFLGLAILFATAAIPLALDGKWAGTVWALEGACIVWLGLRQEYLLGRLFGFALQIASGLLFLADFPASVNAPVFLNAAFLGSLTLALAGFFSAYYYGYKLKDRVKYPWEQSLTIGLFLWGIVWWLIGGINQIYIALVPVSNLPWYTQVLVTQQSGAVYAGLILFYSFSCGLACKLKQYLDWKLLGCIALSLIFGLYISAIQIENFTEREYFIVAWLLGFVTWYLILHKNNELPKAYLEYLHIGSGVLLVIQASKNLAGLIYLTLPLGTIWSNSIYGLIPALSLLAIVTLQDRLTWPLKEYKQAYITKLGVTLFIIYFGHYQLIY